MIALVIKNGKVIVCVDPRYFADQQKLKHLGRRNKARVKLGWTPKISFKELVNGNDT